MWGRIILARGAAFFAACATLQAKEPSTGKAVDALIPWLLQEDAQLRGVPFAQVLQDATGKKVLASNPMDPTHGRVRQIGLTARGRKVVADCHQRVLSLEGRLVSRLSRAEAKQLFEMLRSCSQALADRG